MEVEYWGSCKQFIAQVLPTVEISNYDGEKGCLPILVKVDQNPDVNDLNSHWFCTNTDEKRSIIHFVEIFGPSTETPIPDTPAVTNFVLSLFPDAPIRVLTEKTSVARRPSCFITPDYCEEHNAVVNSCKTAEVEHKKKGVIVNKDRIYITSSQKVSFDCKTLSGECCKYIAPSWPQFGGICPYEASKEEFKLKKDHDDKKGGKKGGKGSAGKDATGKDVPAEKEGKEVVDGEQTVEEKEVAPVAPVEQQQAKVDAPAPEQKSEEENDDDEK